MTNCCATPTPWFPLVAVVGVRLFPFGLGFDYSLLAQRGEKPHFGFGGSFSAGAGLSTSGRSQRICLASSQSFRRITTRSLVADDPFSRAPTYSNPFCVWIDNNDISSSLASGWRCCSGDHWSEKVWLASTSDVNVFLRVYGVARAI